MFLTKHKATTTTMSSSAICPKFSQNAWRKDLCSNCFKSKEDHKLSNSKNIITTKTDNNKTVTPTTITTTTTTTPITTTLMSQINNISTTTAKATSMTTTATATATLINNNNAIKQRPIKSIMKFGWPNKDNNNKILSSTILSSTTTTTTTKKSTKVNFPKELAQVIGYGGDWSDCDDNNSDDDDNNDYNDDFTFNNQNDDPNASISDEEDLELIRLTKSNTDFNMNNGNLLGDATDNIKKSFAALKLGAPQLDAEGKKQTLKICVQPFGATTKMSSMKEKFELSKMEYEKIAKEKKITTKTTSSLATTATTASASASASVKTVKQNKTDLNSNKNKNNKELNNKNIIESSIITTTSKTTTQQSHSNNNNNNNNNNAQQQQSSILNNIKDSLETAVIAQIDSDGTNSPPVERAMEKSLLEEISETLEQKKLEQEQIIATTSETSKIKSCKNVKTNFENDLTSESTNVTPIKTIELKKSIARNPPITKDHVKPKITVFPKFTSNSNNRIDSSDSNNTSDNENNSISAYYDVVETTTASSASNNCYENIPDGKNSKDQIEANGTGIKSSKKKIITNNKKDENKKLFSSSQYITDMLLSSRTKSASYSLHEGSFMTSKITSDGLIVTKCSSDDALDSTGSSFDGSSDEETYNMNRSESDSGIGISITSDYKLTKLDKKCENKKLSVSINNSDYEDIQVIEEEPIIISKRMNSINVQTKIPDKTFSVEKSRELAGEPDGSADPDGTNNQTIENLPALPKSPPPITSPMSASGKVKSIVNDSRSSFLHGLQKNITSLSSTTKKPDVPAKPATVNVLKTFAKRQPTQAEQQLVSQLQQVIKSPATPKGINSADCSREILSRKEGNNNDINSKLLKKGRAPNPPLTNLQIQDLPTPPPTPPQLHEKNYSLNNMDPLKVQADIKKIVTLFGESSPSPGKSSVKNEYFNRTSPILSDAGSNKSDSGDNNNSHSSIYTRNPQLQNPNNIKSTSPVIREKDKRERATINPKFRSLNTFSHRKTQQQLIVATSELKPLTPEPTPRKNNILSMSEECLAADGDKIKQKGKTKFSIKKFLRMGTSKTTDNLHKKDGIYSEICTGEEGNTIGKPRLVIIHPIDINTTGVEVVKDIPKSPTTPDILTATTAAAVAATVTSGIISGKPPAPPQRTLNMDGNKIATYEANKPARPPPPKSAELRRKQKIGFNINLQQSGVAGGSVKTKADNVYANLGEIRSAIAPRKPERTASMREREAQLELARKRNNSNENYSDTISVCSSNGGSITNLELHNCPLSSITPTASATSTLESMFKNKSGQLKHQKQHQHQKQQHDIKDLSNSAINSTESIYHLPATTVTTSTKAQSNSIITSAVNTNLSISTTVTSNKSSKNNYNTNCIAADGSDNIMTLKDEKLNIEKIKQKNNSTSSHDNGKDINTDFTQHKRNSGGATTSNGGTTFLNGKSIASKLEIYEKGITGTISGGLGSDNVKVKLSDGLKDSVRKINNTIDSYLKDKRDYESMYDISSKINKSVPPPTPVRNGSTTLTSSTTNLLLLNEIQNSELQQPQQQQQQQPLQQQQQQNQLSTEKQRELDLVQMSTNEMIMDLRKNYELMMNATRVHQQRHQYNQQQQQQQQQHLSHSSSRSSSFIQDTQPMISGGQSYTTTRSEYGVGGLPSPTKFYDSNRQYANGFNGSLANIPRVLSASYCGSEIGETDIYSPYSFYGGSEAGADVAIDLHDSIWGVQTPAKSRVKTTNRLRMRKGRSVVHKTIEDNYSAVVVANHEALAQVLEQLQQTPTIPGPLRPLANAINLRFDDFTILEGCQAFVVGKRAFHSAIWNTSAVTLALSADCNQISGVSGDLNQLSGGISGVLNPITEFCDLVPNYHLPLMPSTEVRMMQATISVLPRMQLDTLQSIGIILKNKSQIIVDKQHNINITNLRGSIPNLLVATTGTTTTNQQSQQQQQSQQLNENKCNNLNSNLRNVYSVQNLSTLNEEEIQEKSSSSSSDDILNLPPGMPSFDDVMCREVGFIMLQLVNGLKNLQSKAIEEMPLSLTNVILCKEIDNKDAQARLCVLHGLNSDEDEQLGPLCKCAHIALIDMLPSTKLSSILSKILLQERSESLSKAKALLEFVLWGPSDVALTGSIKERELALQRWLDLERATVLHGLVRTRVELTVYDECHLMFLVRSNAKIMNEAAKLVSNLKIEDD